jgi:hypothetical protein
MIDFPWTGSSGSYGKRDRSDVLSVAAVSSAVSRWCAN